MGEFIETAGRWDPSQRGMIFLATNVSRQQALASHMHGNLLIAVNELNDGDVEGLREIVDSGTRLLLDSGIFWLTNEHKRAHGITMDEALGLHPSEIDGFDWLLDRYRRIVDALGDDAWGYIELDQGGKERKRETRAMLHAEGYRPIPVFHPLNDGPDYFDELASTHDRICMGNIVQANGHVRLRLLHFLAEAHRRYPHLWVHVLGMNPTTWFHGLPIDSCDASTWLSPARWGTVTYQAMLRPIAEPAAAGGFSYLRSAEEGRDADTNGDRKALRMSASQIVFGQHGWRHWRTRLEDELGAEMYPDPVLG